MSEEDPLKKFFPFAEYRPYQRETIIEIVKAFSSGKDNVLFEGPTGSGKSVVGMTVANILGTCYYLTIQKNLMTQLVSEFGKQMVDVRGRNAYPCWFMNEHQKSNKHFSADRGKCIQKSKSFLDFCTNKRKCAYKNRLDLAAISPQVLFNFSSFLYQREMATRFTEPKKLLLLDECHNTESQIMNFVVATINGEDIDQTLPNFEEAELYISYFEAVKAGEILLEKLQNAREQLKAITGGDASEVDNLDIQDAEKAGKLLKEVSKYEEVFTKYMQLKEYSKSIRCVSDYDQENNAVSIRPLYATYHTPKLLLPGGEKRLFMSATILNSKVFGESIGLNMSKTHFVKVPHTFPRQNRLIHLDYAGPMTFKSREETMPKLIKKIDEIMDKHAGEKGIIHCQSFKLMNDIIRGLSKKNAGRLLDQSMFEDKDKLLQSHKISKCTVIIAPAMHEGLDLKDDLSRFQIVAKVPYPDSRGNKQLDLRMKENWNYYLWLTAIKLIQSVGRSVRSETDYASTYILDSDFDKFFNQCDKAHLLPDWFIESLAI